MRPLEQNSLPSTLSLEQVAAVIDCQDRLRDRFLFALLASNGMLERDEQSLTGILGGLDAIDADDADGEMLFLRDLAARDQEGAA